MNIVVASNDTFFLEVLKTIVGEDCQNIQADSGPELVKILSELEAELVILDMDLPQLKEVRDTLRQQVQSHSIPVLLIGESVESIAVTDMESLFFPVDDFMSKHFNPERLKSRFARLAKRIEKKTGSFDEQRANPRVPIDVDVTVRNAEGIMFHPAINISKGGIYLELNQNLEEDTLLELRFPIPGNQTLVTAEGKVIWTLEVQEGELWGTGIRFTQVSPANIQKIQAYALTLLRVMPGEKDQTQDTKGN